MKKISTLLIVLAWTAAYTQDSSKVQVKLSINYNSHLNYYGRTDSLRSSGVFPLAEVWFTKNYYVNVAPVFINNALSSFEYAGTIATIGYQKVSEKWISSLSLLKPFYKESSELVQSALKAQASASFTRLNKILNVTAGGDIKYSDKLDFGATAGLDHLIRIENKDNSILVIDLGVYMYAGTQNFSNTYKRKIPGNILNPPSEQQVTKRGTRFSILAYEATVPIVFAKGSWQFTASPSYIMPQNIITIPGRPDLSEKGENLFYATVGLKYIF